MNEGNHIYAMHSCLRFHSFKLENDLSTSHLNAYIVYWYSSTVWAKRRRQNKRKSCKIYEYEKEKHKKDAMDLQKPNFSRVFERATHKKLIKIIIVIPEKNQRHANEHEQAKEKKSEQSSPKGYELAARNDREKSKKELFWLSRKQNVAFQQ